MRRLYVTYEFMLYLRINISRIFGDCRRFTKLILRYRKIISMDKDIIETKKDVEGKNKDKIYCKFCPSKMLNAGAATLTNVEFALPYIHSKAKSGANEREIIFDYWLVEDMYTFENIGVSHTVDNIKYLACADCERGPVGWHDLSTKISYIALCRVKHE